MPLHPHGLLLCFGSASRLAPPFKRRVPSRNSGIPIFLGHACLQFKDSNFIRPKKHDLKNAFRFIPHDVALMKGDATAAKYMHIALKHADLPTEARHTKDRQRRLCGLCSAWIAFELPIMGGIKQVEHEPHLRSTGQLKLLLKENLHCRPAVPAQQTRHAKVANASQTVRQLSYLTPKYHPA